MQRLVPCDEQMILQPDPQDQTNNWSVYHESIDMGILAKPLTPNRVSHRLPVGVAAIFLIISAATVSATRLFLRRRRTSESASELLGALIFIAIFGFLIP
jgi:hypothetical protein